MPQTPISVTTQFNSTTPATMYTVPAGRQAVVNSVLCSSVIGGYPSVTINKVSGGVQYPIVVGAVTGYAAATASNYNTPQNQTLNLLNGPVTLGANESLSISTSTSAAYKFPTSITPTTNPNWRIQNIAYLSSGFYVAVGWDSATGFGLVVTSSNGTTWTRQTFNNQVQLTDIAYDGVGTYVVVGRSNGGFIWYSSNLTSWTAVSATNADMFDVAYGNGRFVVGGASGRIWHSTNALSWTSVVVTFNGLAITSNVNSVLPIGSNWAFGTSGAYFYSSDYSTATVPYYIRDPNGNTSASGFWAINSTGTLISGLGVPDSASTTSIYSSTDQGKSWTAANLSALSNRPQSRCQILAFNNGGVTAWMQYHPSNSRYLASSNGTTWTSQNFTVTYANNNDTWYSSNLWGVNNPNGNSFLNYIYGINAISILSAGSSGTVSESRVFSNSGSYVNPQYGYGLQACGSGNDNSWVAVGVSVSNGQYPAMWYGTAVTDGFDSQYTQNMWYFPTYSYCTTMSWRPAAGGFIFGTAGGWLLTSTGLTNSVTSASRPFSSSVAAIVPSGNSASSRIVALYSNGTTAFSTNQGVTWTAGASIPAGTNFGAGFYATQPPLQYANGTWIAVDNSGFYYYSTDSINWVGNPLNIQSLYSLNNNNVMILPTGLAYTAGTSVDNLVFPNTTADFQTFPSVRRAAYVSGTYVVAGGNTVFTSTDLASWTSAAGASTTINNQTFVVLSSASGTGVIAYSGTGSSMVFASANRTVNADNAYLGLPTPLSTALNVGFATAGVVEIS